METLPPKTINCRLCIAVIEKGIEIYGKKGIRLSVARIITQHYSIKITNNDDRSQFICKHCWQTTEQFHKLYCNVQKIESDHLQNCANQTPQTEQHNAIKSDIKEEMDTFELDSKVDFPVEPCLRQETAVKVEDFLEETLIENDDTDDYSRFDQPDVEYGVDDMEDMEDVPLIRRKRTKRLLRKGIRTVKEINRKDLTLTQQQALREEQEIDNVLGMMCEICSEKTKTFLDLKKHFRRQHEVNGYIRCCEKKFFRRGRLYNHILDHNDPNRYKCEQCGKVFVDPERLKKHVRRHDPSTRKLQCSKCPKRFSAPSTLETHFQRIHQIVDIPKTFFCDICSKSFISKMACSSHIHTVHTQKYSQICDICAKFYPSKRLLDYHYKTTHLKIPMPKIQCTICGSWLANLPGLNKHMRTHNDKEETCNVCGKKAPNKHALTSHIRYAHNTETYQCNICEKIFKSAKSLKEHLGSHTGTYLYKCKYCLMEFNSGANMYKHRKKMHPIEWQQDRDNQMNGGFKNEDDKKLNWQI